MIKYLHNASDLVRELDVAVVKLLKLHRIMPSAVTNRGSCLKPLLTLFEPLWRS